MPKYFFHVYDTDGYTEDSHGAEFSDDERAHVEAVQAAREMLAEKIINGEVVNGSYFEIARHDGTIVETIPLKSVVRFV